MKDLSKTLIDLAVAEAFIQDPGSFDLSNYLTIDSIGAAHLVSHSDSPHLQLGAIQFIDQDSAQVLIDFKGRISLYGLAEINDDVAKNLSLFTYSPIVQDPSIAKAIGHFLGVLQEREAQLMVDFCLDNRTMKDNQLCFVYPLHTGCYLSLSKAAAEVLISIKTPLLFHHITSLSPEVAEVLCQKQHITFSNLTSLSNDSLDALVAGPRKSIMFEKLNLLETKQAEILASSNLRLLSLNGISEISEEIADVFSTIQYDIQLSFDGLKSMPVHVARSLAKMGDFKALSVSFRNLKSLAYESVRELAEFKGAVMTFSKDIELCDKGRELFSKRKRLMLI